LLKLDEAHVARVIFSAAQEVSADLIVVGTNGRAGIAQLLLGSVAQEVLHIADRDVLPGSMLRH
jgi:nucleotide-binding universal stress UspA family protein